jgi:hypothetical protein
MMVNTEWEGMCKEVVAAYFKAHTDTVCTSQETYVSATEANRLMLFGETVAGTQKYTI